MRSIIKDVSLIVFIIILVIVVIFFFFDRLQKIKTIADNEKEIGESLDYQIELQNKIIELKSNPPVTIKEFIKLPDKEKEKAYVKLNDKYNKALILLDETELKLKDVTEQLIKSNELHKKSARKVIVSGIGSFGLDEDLFFKVSGGALVKGMFLNNRLSFGGGGTFDQKFKNDEIRGRVTIKGGSILLELAIYF